MTPAEDEVALQLSAAVICHQNGAINKIWAGISHLAEALSSSLRREYVGVCVMY